MRYALDCEFDGHGGPLISMALVPFSGSDAYYVYNPNYEPNDPWVAENVMPILKQIPDGIRYDVDTPEWFGVYLRDYLYSIMQDPSPQIFADSPVDIWRFCQVISTDSRGNWRSTDFPSMSFEVYNVDCWPNEHLPDEAVQHNAYWDARALITGIK